MNSTGKMPHRHDFNRAPFLVLWELTRACALACQHCRAEAMREPNPAELSTVEAMRLLEQLKEFGSPLIVLTGGDPIERRDVFEIIQEARRLGFKVAVTPSATPLVTRQAVRRLKESGLERLAISIDGPDAQHHDSFRGVSGSFSHTLSIISWAHEVGLPVQINTTVCRQNLSRFQEMAQMVDELGAVLWSVFFLVLVGRARADMQITADEAESVLEKMAELADSAPYDVKSTAAPHFRRVLIQRYAGTAVGSHAQYGSLRAMSCLGGAGILPAQAGGTPTLPGENTRFCGHISLTEPYCSNAGAEAEPAAEQVRITPQSATQGTIQNLDPRLRLGALRSYQAVNDGKGIIFISDTGDIQPSGFLPIVAGNVRKHSVISIYREHSLFQALRDPDRLKGKCGICRYRVVCGGSRARAYGNCGDYLAADSLCVYREGTK